MDDARLTALRAWVLGCALALPLFQMPAIAQSSTSPQGTTLKAADRIAPLLDALRRVRTPTIAAISPDGNYVAWTVEGSSGSELHLTGIAPPSAIQDAAWDRVLSPDTIGDVTNLRPGACPSDHPAWSPDGKQLAFLSGCDLEEPNFSKTKQKNIFIWTLATNQMRQLTHLKGELSSLQWSPTANPSASSSSRTLPAAPAPSTP